MFVGNEMVNNVKAGDEVFGGLYMLLRGSSHHSRSARIVVDDEMEC